MIVTVRAVRPVRACRKTNHVPAHRPSVDSTRPIGSITTMERSITFRQSSHRGAMPLHRRSTDSVVAMIDRAVEKSQVNTVVALALSVPGSLTSSPAADKCDFCAETRLAKASAHLRQYHPEHGRSFGHEDSPKFRRVAEININISYWRWKLHLYRRFNNIARKMANGRTG